MSERTPEREVVYKLIDGERAYQRKLCESNGWWQKDSPTVAEELLMIETYARQARDVWCKSQGDTEALEMIRKVAGMCVRCMEAHKTPPRQ